MAKKQKSPYGANRALAIVNKFFPGVKAVKDSNEPLRISVTATDTKAPGRKKHAECVIANACKRGLGMDALVSVSRVYLIKNGVATRYEVPPSVAREITSYDRGAGFEPGDYVLRKPSSDHRLGTRRPSVYGPKAAVRPVPTRMTAGIRAALR